MRVEFLVRELRGKRLFEAKSQRQRDREREKDVKGKTLRLILWK
jgi:hypothetical protein